MRKVSGKDSNVRVLFEPHCFRANHTADSITTSTSFNSGACRELGPPRSSVASLYAPQPSSTTRDGAALAIAERRKRAAYPELLRRGPQRLRVLVCETGGRWNDESLRLVAQLVRSRALRAPAPLRGAATQGWHRRWWSLLSVAVQSTHAATLLGTPPVHAPMPGAQAPHLQDVLHDACPPVPSCLPAR